MTFVLIGVLAALAAIVGYQFLCYQLQVTAKKLDPRLK